MIIVHRRDGHTFECHSGHRRLLASLQIAGKATVIDAETRETFEVHLVDGEIVVLDDGRGAVAETIAAAAVSKAAVNTRQG